MFLNDMKKKDIINIKGKNKIIDNILNIILTKEHFLILGHQNPDEDCLASMVAFALLLIKFYKGVNIFLPGKVHEHFEYLINICKFNSINLIKTDAPILENIDTLVVLDTPKPSMLEVSQNIKDLLQDKNIVKIEVDHHLGADSEYIGDLDYCLVAEASSTAELIGHILFKLKNKIIQWW